MAWRAPFQIIAAPDHRCSTIRVPRGSVVAPYDDGELLRLAELRASSGLKLPDCCVPDVAIHHQASLATFDDTLAAAARTRSVPASTNGAANPIRPASLDIMSLIGL